MILPTCFTTEWIISVCKTNKNRSINPALLEKMIHAFSLLDHLKRNQLKFIFKGGTSLLLLLPEPRRLSIDIDITTIQNRIQIEDILDKIMVSSHFKSWELQDSRSFNSQIPKAHYTLQFYSEIFQRQQSVLLDVIFEQVNYPKTFYVPIKFSWIVTESLLEVEVPSIDSMLGDKLTAFAPNTTGIQFKKGKETEIIKQLFDIGDLFDEAQNIKEIKSSFEEIAQKQMQYRGLALTFEDVLDDIHSTSLLIAKRNRNTDPSQRENFEEIMKGIKKFENFIIQGRFKIEDAVIVAGKVAYLTRLLRMEGVEKIEKYQNQDIRQLTIDGEFSFLNKLKKSRDKSGFFYWYMATKLKNQH